MCYYLDYYYIIMSKDTKATESQENTEVKAPEKKIFKRYCVNLNLVVEVEFTKWDWLYEREEKCAELIERRDKGEDITKEIIYS